MQQDNYRQQTSCVLRTGAGSMSGQPHYHQKNHHQHHHNNNNNFNHHQQHQNNHYLHLQPSSQNIVHKQQTAPTASSASRLKQLTNFALHQRQQAVANELAAKAAEAAATAALARHQQQQQQQEAAFVSGDQQLSYLVQPTSTEQTFADERLLQAATVTSGSLLFEAPTVGMLVDSAPLASGQQSMSYAPQQQQARGRVNSIGRMQATPSLGSPGPFAARSVSFSSSCDLANRHHHHQHHQQVVVAASPQCPQCSPPLAASQTTVGAVCTCAEAQLASPLRELPGVQSPAASYVSSGHSTGGSNGASPALHSGAHSAANQAASMSASDALSLGINLEQYISKRNERERSRVRNVNDAFDNLKNSLPLDVDKMTKRMSKVEILRTAIGYIRDLEGVLGNKHHQPNYPDMAPVAANSPSQLTLVGQDTTNNNNNNENLTSAMTQPQFEPTTTTTNNLTVLMNNSQQYLNQQQKTNNQFKAFYEFTNTTTTNNNNNNYIN